MSGDPFVSSDFVNVRGGGAERVIVETIGVFRGRASTWQAGSCGLQWENISPQPNRRICLVFD